MKNKGKLTEDDVIKANSSIIFGLCRQYGKKLEYKDRISIANLGMFFAIRTYCKGISEFRTYAASCILEALYIEQDNQRKARRVEHPLSLNMQVKSNESTQCYIEMFAHPKSDFSSNIIFSDFLSRLNKNNGTLHICVFMAIL